MVDYSKWDNLEVSSDEEAGGSTSPQVTRLAQPSSVTFGGPRAQALSVTTASQQRRSTTTTPVKELTANGTRCDKYLWAQSGDEIILSVFLPRTAKARNVNLALSRSGNVRVEYQNAMVLDEQLVRDVWGAPEARATAMKMVGKMEEDVKMAHAQLLGVSEEEIVAKEMEWIVEDAPKEIHDGRLLIVRLKKLPPSREIKEEWWSKLFVSEEKEVDTAAIPGRKPGGNAEKFQAAWEEAHTEFVRRRKAGEPLQLGKG